MVSELHAGAIVKQQDQDRVNLLAAELEPLAIEAWPARSRLEIGGWLLRFTDGYSHRGNSVAAIGFEGGDIHAQVALAEIAYFTRELSPMFQIAPVSQPAGLEDFLIERGYVCEAPTHVMVADANAIKAGGSDAALSSEPNSAFRSLVLSGSNSYADGCERLDIVSRIEAPRIFATIGGNGEAACCGMAVVTKGWGGINLMRTRAALRRKGLGMEILSALAKAAREKGATKLYLQAEDGNPAARMLYAKAGFKDAYAYRFYRAS
jgi:hypothetical protein